MATLSILRFDKVMLNAGISGADSLENALAGEDASV
jgi:hypothetical protein